MTIKEEMQQVIEIITSQLEAGRQFEPNDIRHLSCVGVPIIDILRKNIPLECLKKGFDDFLKSL